MNLKEFEIIYYALAISIGLWDALEILSLDHNSFKGGGGGPTQNFKSFCSLYIL